MDSALITLLTGTGVSGVFCCLFVIGAIYPRSVVNDLKEENRELKADRDSQRGRADTAVAAMQSTRDVMAAMQAGIQIARDRDQDLRAQAIRQYPELREPK